MRSDPSKAGWGLKAATWAGVLFLHIPLALIILYAFSAEDKSYVFPPPALTTQWFGVAWQREDVWAAIRLSFEVAAWSTAIAVVLGALAAAALARTTFFGRDAISLLLIPPIALPGVITGIALRSAYGTLHIPFSFWTIVIGHATFCVVVVFNNAIARLRRLNPNLIEASMDLGADGFQTVRHIILPQLGSALLAGALLAFALSFDEIIVTTFTAGQQCRPQLRQDDVAHGLEAVGAQVHRGFDQVRVQPSQPRDGVVEHHHHAEGGMADDDGPERERNVQRAVGRAQRDSGDDAGQRDRQDQQQRDRITAKEGCARQRCRGQRAQQHGDGRGPCRDLEAELDRRPHVLALPRHAEPLRGQRRRREDVALVLGAEGIEDDQRQRDVQKSDGRPGGGLEPPRCATLRAHRRPPAAWPATDRRRRRRSAPARTPPRTADCQPRPAACTPPGRCSACCRQ